MVGGELAPGLSGSLDRLVGSRAGRTFAGGGSAVAVLILPGVRVPNLASHVLAKASKALAAEWRRARGTAPLLEYTYVDPSRAGTCYRAAGWQRCAGRTSGRPPGGRRTSPKAVWVHPLSRHWRRALCAESGARLPMWSGSRHWPIQADWADREYGARTLGDARLRRRLVDMGRAWARSSGLVLAAGVLPPRHSRKEPIACCRIRVSRRSMCWTHIASPRWIAAVWNRWCWRCRTPPC